MNPATKRTNGVERQRRPLQIWHSLTPEASTHSSIKARVDHYAARGQLDTLNIGSIYASKINVVQVHWLFLIEDHRDQNGRGLAGLLRGVSLSGYLQRVDWSSRLIRPGKRKLSAAVRDILTRLEIDVDCWKETLQGLLGPNKKIGSDFGGTNRLPPLNRAPAERSA